MGVTVVQLNYSIKVTQLTAPRHTHVPRQCWLVVAAVDDEVVAFGFAGYGFVDGIGQKFVAFGGAQRGARRMTGWLATCGRAGSTLHLAHRPAISTAVNSPRISTISPTGRLASTIFTQVSLMTKQNMAMTI